jgi:hypothetical protein
MNKRKVVLLDGSPAGDESYTPIRSLLTGVLEAEGFQVEIITLKEISMAHCIGCFGCWLETPGACVLPDAGREVTGAVIRSEMTLLFTPVSFGGYSSELKKALDRWLPLVLPYFLVLHGEIHHTPRYRRYPRLVGIGVQRGTNVEEADLFRALVGRNAVNFHAPSHAADAVDALASPDVLTMRFRDLLARQDTPRFGAAVQDFLPGGADASPAAVPDARRALLIVGSPKVKSPSTSGVMGGYLLERLREQGWECETVTLTARLLKDEGESELLRAVDHASLVILAFPLYIDAFPFLVTRALERIAAHRRQAAGFLPGQRLAVLCQNGFPEAHQNALALAICRQFALQCGMGWQGALAMGGGEALCSGEPLSAGASRGRPPAGHLMKALDLTAAALAAGHPVPAAAQELIRKSPIPLFPFAAWRWLFRLVGSRHWQQRAARFGVGKKQMLDRPYDSA